MQHLKLPFLSIYIFVPWPKIVIVSKLIKTMVCTSNDKGLGGKVHTHNNITKQKLSLQLCYTCTCRRSTHTSKLIDPVFITG